MKREGTARCCALSSDARAGTRLATLAAAWEAVHANTPAGWQVGRPAYVDRYREWRMYAFDPSERPVVGWRSRESVASGQTELDCIEEMARCLAEIRAGRWPQ